MLCRDYSPAVRVPVDESGAGVKVEEAVVGGAAQRRSYSHEVHVCGCARIAHDPWRRRRQFDPLGHSIRKKQNHSQQLWTHPKAANHTSRNSRSERKAGCSLFQLALHHLGTGAHVRTPASLLPTVDRLLQNYDLGTTVMLVPSGKMAVTEFCCEESQ